MKIQEVFEATGLSKRTIRFYIEKELIDPEVYEKGDKEYREYSEQDIADLRSIAELRKASFSIAQIKQMMDKPKSIPGVFEEYRAEVRSGAKNFGELLRAVENVDTDKVADIHKLASALGSIAANRELPEIDRTPRFGQLDEVEWEEKPYNERVNYIMPPQFNISQAQQFRGLSADMINLNMRQPEFAPKSKILASICIALVALWFICASILREFDSFSDFINASRPMLVVEAIIVAVVLGIYFLFRKPKNK